MTVRPAPAFDPTDPAFVADPYPTYAALREHDPVAWYEPGEMWLVSRHRDVDAALRDRRLGRVFAPKEPLERFAPWNLLNEHAMLELEPPDHTRLRSLVSKAFTPRRVERLRGRVRELADGFLDPLEDGAADLVAMLAEPLPVAVIAELLGVPVGDRPLLRPWSNAIVALYELDSDAATADRAIRAAAEFDAYVRDLIGARRARPGDDLLSALVEVRDAGDRLSEDELVATAILLLNAGHEASVNVIGNGVRALLAHRDQWERLREDPAGLAQPATEEVIRYDTPLSLFQRTAFEPVQVGAVTIPAGQRVGLLLGSANHDPEVFTAPDRLDITRWPNPHVGFGAGIHFCLGAPLARVEIQEVLRALVTRFPGLELVAEPTPRPSYQFRGYTALHVAAAPPRTPTTNG